MGQELGLDRQVGVFPLSDRFAEMGGIPVSRAAAKRTTGLSMTSESVRADWPAETSYSPYGECDFESKRTGKTSGSERFAR